jgi:hypothetical protein
MKWGKRGSQEDVKSTCCLHLLAVVTTDRRAAGERCRKTLFYQMEGKKKERLQSPHCADGRTAGERRNTVKRRGITLNTALSNPLILSPLVQEKSLLYSWLRWSPL